MAEPAGREDTISLTVSTGWEPMSESQSPHPRPFGREFMEQEQADIARKADVARGLRERKAEEKANVCERSLPSRGATPLLRSAAPSRSIGWLPSTRQGLALSRPSPTQSTRSAHWRSRHRSHSRRTTRGWQSASPRPRVASASASHMSLSAPRWTVYLDQRSPGHGRQLATCSRIAQRRAGRSTPRSRSVLAAGGYPREPDRESARRSGYSSTRRLARPRARRLVLAAERFALE